MKNIWALFAMLAPALLSVSCLKDDLSGGNLSPLAEMTDFRLYFEWKDTTVDQRGTANEFARITVKAIQFDYTKAVNSKAGTIKITPAFPLGFPAKYKSVATTKRIWGVAFISSAAVIAPLPGAPALGAPADFSNPAAYQITAANGDKKTWTVTVDPLPPINKYEGNYHSTCHVDAPSDAPSSGAPEPGAVSEDSDLDKYLSSVDANTVSGPHSDLGSNGYTYTIKINADNSCVVTQYNAGVLIGEMTPGLENRYYPNEKKFVLNYRYMGSDGYRTINETLVLIP